MSRGSEAAARELEMLAGADVPELLFLCVAPKGLRRAIKRGAFQGPDGGPIACYRNRRAAARGLRDRPEDVLVRISAREALGAGARFYAGPRGRVESYSIPISCASVSELPRSLRRVDRIEAAGGVVVRDGRRPRVLLLRKEEDGAARWVLPKGRRRRQEPRKQAARREVLEETGLPQVDILRFLGRETYFDDDGGRVVFKRVSYYLMVCPDRKARVRARREEGFAEGRWVSFDTALASTGPLRAGRALREALAAVAEGAS